MIFWYFKLFVVLAVYITIIPDISIFTVQCNNLNFSRVIKLIHAVKKNIYSWVFQYIYIIIYMYIYMYY